MVVSQDVDIVVPVHEHARVKRSLRDIHELEPSQDESSVWLPKHHRHLVGDLLRRLEKLGGAP